MRKIKKMIEQGEKGAALLWVAGSLVVLLTTAAFATDLGWVLLWNSRLQSAADAAALAGVVNLPGFPGFAEADAIEAAAANGFPGAGLEDEILADNSYKVTLTSEVNTFFLKLIGFDTFTLSQTATAQYIKPVRLGSPDNTFGGPGSNFWAAINAQYTEVEQGDPYASQCIDNGDRSGGDVPPDDFGCNTVTPDCSVAAAETCYREGGYYYAIEVDTGSSDLTVDFFDPGFFANGGGDDSSGTTPPGDSSWRWDWPSNHRGVYLEYNLFAPDTTPTDPTDNSNLACQGSYGVNGGAGDGPNSWVNGCSITGSLTPGIWVLQLPSPLYEGSSKFGIRANVGSGTTPRIYGILDMSIYVNFSGGQAEPYLAEIREEHAGKVLQVDIWDLGDVDGPAGSANIRFIDPVGGAFNPPACSWTSTSPAHPSSGGTISDCIIDISGQRFNAQWLHVTIPLPDPVCNPALGEFACWWKLHINSAGQAHDRTTWRASISGDPVRITQ